MKILNNSNLTRGLHTKTELYVVLFHWEKLGSLLLHLKLDLLLVSGNTSFPDTQIKEAADIILWLGKWLTVRLPNHIEKAKLIHHNDSIGESLGIKRKCLCHP